MRPESGGAARIRRGPVLYPIIATLLFGCGSENASKPAESPPLEPALETDQAAEPAHVAELESKRAPMTEPEFVKAAIADLDPAARLGARLFYENRLSNPGANLATSCRSCHVPPEASGGDRMWADETPYSVMPANRRGGKLETQRNTPTLLDLDVETTYGLDGAFESLDAFLARKLLSEHMGWVEGDELRAKDEIFALLLNDDGSDVLAEGSYREQFQTVKGVDVFTLDSESGFELVITSLTDYLATVRTYNTSAYDALAYLNRFMEGLANEADTPQDLAGRIAGRIANQEGRVLIRFPNVYDEAMYQGYKTFVRVAPTASSSVEGMERNVGNCIACHVPPKFTDGKFHNIGVTQMAYDAAHGDGSFIGLPLELPSASTASRIDPDDPSKVDLGRWNVEPTDTNIGAFKTPKLRNPLHTDPYMHDGQSATLEDAIRLHISAAEMARSGKLRNPDPQLLKISGLTDEDVANLVAFVESLNEVDPEAYRDYRISNVRIRQDPLGEQTYEN